MYVYIYIYIYIYIFPSVGRVRAKGRRGLREQRIRGPCDRPEGGRRVSERRRPRGAEAIAVRIVGVEMFVSTVYLR